MLNKVNYIPNETIITAENLNEIQDEIINRYPIGSIYLSVNATSPAALFGGVWEQIKDTFLLTAGDVYIGGTTGGSAIHAHTTAAIALTISQMPKHRHTPANYNTAGSDTTQKRQFMTALGLNSDSTARRRYQSGTSAYVISATTSGDITNTSTTSYEGLGEAHNHGDTTSASSLPPYLTIYAWKRVE